MRSEISIQLRKHRHNIIISDVPEYLKLSDIARCGTGPRGEKHGLGSLLVAKRHTKASVKQ